MKLYDYQMMAKEEIKRKLKSYNKCFFMAQERFGKTHTSLTALQDMGVTNVLFVTVKNALKGIKGDYIQGGYEFGLNVVNYESLHKIPHSEPTYDAIIFDESTKLAGYPKPTLNYKRAKEVVKQHKPQYILWLNATPNSESYVQRYYPLQVADFWAEKTFYKWHKVYGIPATKQVSATVVINDYSVTKDDMVINDTEYLFVTGTRQQANFEYYDSKIVRHIVPATEEQLKISNILKEDKIYSDIVVADTAVKLMTKLHQITGGFVYDEERIAYPISTNKYKYILDHSQGDKIAIYAKYTHEVNTLVKYFGACTDVHEFKTNKHRYLVKQIKSGAKGIDLSFCSQHWFFSLDFSGETFTQAIARQHNKKRDKPVEAFILITEGMIDGQVLNAVERKDNFTTQLYRRLA